MSYAQDLPWQPPVPCPAPVLLCGVYRHFKGGLYSLLHLARHHETDEWWVCYMSLRTGDVFIRPAAEWSQTVAANCKRFSYIGSAAHVPT